MLVKFPNLWRWKISLIGLKGTITAEFRHFYTSGTPPANGLASGDQAPVHQTGDQTMQTTTTFFHRSLAVFGSVAMTMALLAGYFTAPAASAVSGVLA